MAYLATDRPYGADAACCRFIRQRTRLTRCGTARHAMVSPAARPLRLCRERDEVHLQVSVYQARLPTYGPAVFSNDGP